MSASRSPFESLSRLPGDCPLTWSLIGMNALTFVVAFIGGGALWSSLTFHTGALIQAPWSIVTYPLVGANNILWLLISAYMLWLFGGSLERGWGIRDYALFLVMVSAATALALWLGAGLLGRGAFLAGLGMPLAASVVAWAAINPSERLLLYFVIPVQARWLAIIVLVFVFFSFPFPLGLFALAGCGVAWWYVRTGRYQIQWGTLRAERPRAAPRSRRPRPAGSPLILNPVAAYRRWKTKQRFMRLMRDMPVRDDGDKGPH